MSVRTLRDDLHVIDYYPQGRRGQRVRIRFRGSAAEAEAYERELRQHRAVSNPLNPTVAALIPPYQQWIALFRAPSTCRDVAVALRHLAPHFGPHHKIRCGQPRESSTLSFGTNPPLIRIHLDRPHSRHIPRPDIRRALLRA